MKSTKSAPSRPSAVTNLNKPLPNILTVATYNILHGYHRELILQSIRGLIKKGTDVICLQETERPCVQPLNKLFGGPDFNAWKIHYAHAGRGGNLALAWNSSRLASKGFETVLLPTLPGATLVQWLQGNTWPLQRAALAGTFSVDDKVLRISSVQLAWEGGSRYRMRQLAFFRDALTRSAAFGDIIGGDFNTIAPSLFRRNQQAKVGRVLGPEYTSALPDLPWTCDLSYTAPEDWWYNAAKILKPLGIKARSRLDYLFARNLKVVSAEMLDWPGSDHRPLIGTFSHS